MFIDYGYVHQNSSPRFNTTPTQQDHCQPRLKLIGSGPSLVADPVLNWVVNGPGPRCKASLVLRRLLATPLSTGKRESLIEYINQARSRGRVVEHRPGKIENWRERKRAVLQDRER